MNSLKSPLSAREILECSFLENRARLLEVAAFLDRMERAGDAVDIRNDYRRRALLRAVECLLNPSGDRVKTILESLSDPTVEPIPSAVGIKNAVGAWRGDISDDH